jgi:hypothetical protein
LTCCSEFQLGSPPVSPLSVVADFVVSLVPNPVGHGAILLYLFCESYLLSERLDGTLKHQPRDNLTISFNCYLINNLNLFPLYIKVKSITVAQKSFSHSSLRTIAAACSDSLRGSCSGRQGSG